VQEVAPHGARGVLGHVVLGMDARADQLQYAQRGLPPALDKPVRPGVNGWVCRGVECLAPIGGLDELVRQYVPKAAERL
jgi:hypothetical protein